MYFDKTGKIKHVSGIKIGHRYDIMFGDIRRYRITILSKPDSIGRVLVEDERFKELKQTDLTNFGVSLYEDKEIGAKDWIKHV